jgi:hypothetical protein
MNHDYNFLILILSAATNVVLIISVFRRRPPIDEEFVKWTGLREHCKQNHKPVKSEEQLRASFVPSELYEREIEQRDEWRREVNGKLDKLLLAVGVIAKQQGVEIEL